VQSEGCKVSLFAQEPIFTALDEEFLRSLGFTILEVDKALAVVDSSTFLFVPHLEWTTETPYRAKAVDIPLYITSRMEWVIEEAERSTTHQQEESSEAISTAKAILDRHRELHFPSFEYSDALGMTIYMPEFEWSI